MITAYVLLAVLAAISLAYALAMLLLMRGLNALRRIRPQTPRTWPSVSVVVPARNEAEVLERTLQSLVRQDYPGEWEIVVVDDRSTDRTPGILSAFCRSDARVKAVRVTDPHPPSPKKNALALGIRESAGEIIVTTDADCVYYPGWLRAMTSHFAADVGVVAGLTVFDLPVEPIPEWQRIQWLDFLAQQFVAAGAAGAGVPSSCNGSNLAYRREVFDRISGFGASAAIVSGDDVLFAQRVVKLTRWKVVFATEPQTIVRSLPVQRLREVFDQRIRWASKGLAYRRSMRFFLFGIYVYYALCMASAALALMLPSLIPFVVALALWKLAWDYSVVRLGCRVFGQRGLLRHFLPFAVLHTLLTPVFGIGGLLAPYRWKGEWYRTAVLPRRLRRNLVRVRRMVADHGAANSAA